MKEKFTVTGMTCSACSAGIERTLKKMDGIKSVEVSLMGESMNVEYDEAIVSREAIVAAVKELGYGATLFDAAEWKRQKPQTNTLKRRFFISLLFLIPLMYFSMGEMVGLPQPSPTVNYTVQLILTALITAVNFRFFTNGVKALLNGCPTWIPSWRSALRLPLFIVWF